MTSPVPSAFNNQDLHGSQRDRRVRSESITWEQPPPCSHIPAPDTGSGSRQSPYLWRGSGLPLAPPDAWEFTGDSAQLAGAGSFYQGDVFCSRSWVGFVPCPDPQ